MSEWVYVFLYASSMLYKFVIDTCLFSYIQLMDKRNLKNLLCFTEGSPNICIAGAFPDC